jgi:hypothetical protein
MNTLANYTQPTKEDNFNIRIHSPHPFEVNENLNSSEVLLTEKLQDSPMDLSTSKPCHSLVHFAWTSYNVQFEYFSG